MKLVKSAVTPGASTARQVLWKILVVDDEPDVIALTRLSLKDFRFAGHGLDIVAANSGQAAREILSGAHDFAVAIIDVVMETDDAGLRLVEFIRKDLDNQMLRIVIRTGQPGIAPERFVIDHYDIDDYKDKTELTATRLYTTVRSAIKAYRDLKIIDMNRIGLAHVLQAAPDIYRLATTTINQFFEGVLTQIVGLCNLSETSCVSTLSGVAATFDGKEVNIRATCGGFGETRRFEEVREHCTRVINEGRAEIAGDKGTMIVPLLIGTRPVGFVYVESQSVLSESDRKLVSVLAQQCSSALENMRLHMDVRESFDHAIDMLAEVAEYKDKSTGGHISRIDRYTRAVALELGVSPDEAELWGKASRLHDVGKIGISDAVLQKPGRLSDEEFAEIRKHTDIGGSILNHDKFMDLAREVARSHHERWDGKGYPDGKHGHELALVTRIVSVVDVFDALLSPRPYKEAWPLEEARSEIQRGAGNQFDPMVVDAFLKILDRGDFDAFVASSNAGETLPKEAIS